jgi:hypothetical protein
MADLYKNYEADIYDGLITNVVPQIVTGAATIRKLGTAGTLKRGTVLAKSSGSAGDGKLVILGTSAVSNETLTAYGILCDDTEVGTASDVNALVYLAGSFDPGRLIIKEGYTMVEDDIDALRNGGIILKAQIDADYVAP